jgi:hypothetical protein
MSDQDPKKETPGSDATPTEQTATPNRVPPVSPKARTTRAKTASGTGTAPVSAPKAGASKPKPAVRSGIVAGTASTSDRSTTPATEASSPRRLRVWPD